MENDFRTFELSNAKERVTFRNEEKMRYCAVLLYNSHQRQHYRGIYIFMALRVICGETEKAKYCKFCLQAPPPPNL